MSSQNSLLSAFILFMVMCFIHVSMGAIVLLVFILYGLTHDDVEDR